LGFENGKFFGKYGSISQKNIGKQKTSWEVMEVMKGKIATICPPLVISLFISPSNYSYKYHKP
jgi:TnpA family transposase